MAFIDHLEYSRILVIFCTVTVAFLVHSLATRRRVSTTTTPLKGPKTRNLLGFSRDILLAEDHGSLFESWEKEFGPVFQVPSLGRNHVVLCDPKAIAHYYLKDTYVYQQTPIHHFVWERFVSDISLHLSLVL